MKPSIANFRRVKKLPSNTSGEREFLTTQEIIRSPVGQNLHRLNNDELKEMRVSSFSLWGDSGWTFDRDRLEVERSGVNWEIEFEDKTKLSDEENSELLNWLKRLVWSLLVTPGPKGVSKSISSMEAVNVGMKTVVRWLYKYNIKYPSEITEEVFSDFLEDLPDILDSDGSVSISQVTLPLMFFEYLWRQRDELTLAGIPPMPQNPFLLDSVYSVARRISEKDIGWIEPLPDSVMTLILNSAQKFINDYGSKIIELISNNYEEYFLEFLNQESGLHNSKVNAELAAKEQFIKCFPSSQVEIELFSQGINYDESEERYGILRGLMIDLAGACVLIILGCTGMRVSDLAGVKSKEDGDGPLRIGSSPSELFDMYYLSSILVKSIPRPANYEWLAGIKLKESSDIPPVVNAYNMLNDLFLYPRRILKTKKLFVSLPPGRGLPRTEKGVGSVLTGHLRDWMHKFFENRVDFSQLPNKSRGSVDKDDILKYKTSKGRCIKPTQLRKSFALFTIQVDSKLIPAVAMHFKHYSYAVTESSYIGSNPELLSDRNSLALQKTASLFYEIVSGNIDVAGRRGNMLEDSLKNAVPNTSNKSRWKFVQDLASNIGVYAWFQADGTCLPLDSSDMLCHIENGSLPKYGEIRPEVKCRRISLCSGCKNYLITSDNKDAWVERFKENYLYCLQKEFLNEDNVVFKKRVQIARTWLNKLNVNLEIIESEVKGCFEVWKSKISSL